MGKAMIGKIGAKATIGAEAQIGAEAAIRIGAKAATRIGAQIGAKAAAVKVRIGTKVARIRANQVIGLAQTATSTTSHGIQNASSAERQNLVTEAKEKEKAKT